MRWHWQKLRDLRTRFVAGFWKTRGAVQVGSQSGETGCGQTAGTGRIPGASLSCVRGLDCLELSRLLLRSPGPDTGPAPLGAPCLSLQGGPPSPVGHLFTVSFPTFTLSPFVLVSLNALFRNKVGRLKSPLKGDMGTTGLVHFGKLFWITDKGKHTTL